MACWRPINNVSVFDFHSTTVDASSSSLLHMLQSNLHVQGLTLVSFIFEVCKILMLIITNIHNQINLKGKDAICTMGIFELMILADSV